MLWFLYIVGSLFILWRFLKPPLTPHESFDYFSQDFMRRARVLKRSIERNRKLVTNSGNQRAIDHFKSGESKYNLAVRRANEKLPQYQAELNVDALRKEVIKPVMDGLDEVNLARDLVIRSKPLDGDSGDHKR